MLLLAGSYADFTASKKEWLAKVTDKFPLQTGGGVPLVSLTAMQVAHPASHQQICVLCKSWYACEHVQTNGLLPSECRHLSEGCNQKIREPYPLSSVFGCECSELACRDGAGAAIGRARPSRARAC